MRKASLHLLAWLLPALSLPAQQEGEPAFLAELARTRSLLRQGHWQSALDRLGELLQAHEGKGYVLMRRGDIEDIHRSCTFHLSHPAPKPESLLSGSLERYSPRSGRIKLLYREKTLEGDFDHDEGVFRFPPRFAGPHSIRFRHPGGALVLHRVILCATTDRCYLVTIKEARPKRKILLYDLVQGREPVVAAEASLPDEKDRKIRSIRFKVSHRSLKVLVNNRSALSLKKDRERWGHFAFAKCRYGSLEIEGLVEPSWIQGKIDAEMQKRMAAFRKGYAPRKVLPRWLYPSPPVAGKKEAEEPVLPGDPSAAQKKGLEPLIGLLASGHAAEAMARLEKLTDREVPAAAREFLLALCCRDLGREEEALEHATRAGELDPGSAPARRVKIALLTELRRREAAVAELRALVEADGRDRKALVELASLLLASGRIEEARKAVEEGFRRMGWGGGELKEIYELTTKALNGPDWHRVYDFKTPNYHIHSDIGMKICRDAGRVLEYAYRAFNLDLKWTKDRKRKRFRVYLFAGQAGYDAFCRNLTGVSPTNSAGLFSPALKHLLIWNLPNRERMMETIRHEGFHQYLDRFMVDPPTWFNEGLAEYYERAGTRSGRWEAGGVRRDHLLQLGDAFCHLVPLEHFTRLAPRNFYGRRAVLNYAQAWAFIHFLRHGPRENQELFDTLFRKLQESRPTKRVVAEVFPAARCRQLDAELRSHLLDLKY